MKQMGKRDLQVPHRNHSPRGSIAAPARQVSPSPAVPPPHPSPTSPKSLADVRQDLGFDDIPISQQDDDKSLRDVLGVWIAQAFHIKHPDNKPRRAYEFLRHKKFLAWKDDLKWALQADLEDEVRPGTPPAKTSPTSTHAHIAAQQATIQTPPSPRPIAATEAAKSIEININFGSVPKLPALSKLPTVNQLVTKVRAIHWTRRRIIAIGIVAVAIVSASVWHFVPGLPGVNKTQPGTVTSTKTDQKPEYATMLPGDKSIESLGGWHRVSPPDRAPVFAYADTIDGVKVNISQQPLPDSFKPDVDKSIAELAKSYSATDKITNDSLTMYVGTSAQGPQSVILAKDSLLILMKSTGKIDDKSWAAYAESLK
jgi:hypothetical protein